MDNSYVGICIFEVSSQLSLKCHTNNTQNKHDTTERKDPLNPPVGGGVNSQNINPQTLAITGVPADCVIT